MWGKGRTGLWDYILSGTAGTGGRYENIFYLPAGDTVSMTAEDGRLGAAGSVTAVKII